MSISLAKQITQLHERKPTVFVIALNAKNLLAQHQTTFEQAPYKSLPATPVIYVLPEATHNQSGRAVTIPTNHTSLRLEPHLGVVFNRQTSRVSVENALSYVGAYQPVALYSLPNDSYYRPDIEGRCQEGWCVLGQPVNVLALSSPETVAVEINVNQQCKKAYTQPAMQHSIAELISFLSQFIPFQAGDILLTGTDANPVLVNQGDCVEVSFVGLGSLSNQIN